MFVGCSEISINVFVKHKQHVGIIWPSCLPGGTYSFFQCSGGEKKNAGLWFAKAGSAPRSTLWHGFKLKFFVSIFQKLNQIIIYILEKRNNLRKFWDFFLCFSYVSYVSLMFFLCFSYVISYVSLMFLHP